MDLIQTIQTRRTVRDYLPREVDVDIVQRLLRAAVQAPSAMNHQPCRFAIVQSAGQLKRYSDAAKQMLLAQRPDDHKFRGYADMLSSLEFNIFYNAGTLIVVCVEEKGPYVEADAWLAAENLMLAACAEGLGTCCVGFAVGVLNTPAVKEELGIPPQGVAIAPIIVGYPHVVPPPVPRKDPRILSWCR